MRVSLELSADGDIRCRLLRDQKHIQKGAPLPVPPLVCSNEVQEMTTVSDKSDRVGFGSISTRNTFGRRAKKVVRCAGAVLDRAPLSRLVFLTGTLPGSTPESFKALAAWSGWVVQTLLQWVRDTTGDTRCFGVWEYQRRGALHLHMCVECPTAELAAEIRRKWKARWIRILDGVAARAKVDVYRRDLHHTWCQRKWLTRTDAQIVQKSVGSYLSKYLSKGSSANRRLTAFPPSRWWFVSRSVRREIEQSRQCTTVLDLEAGTGQQILARVSQFLEAGGARVAHSYESPVDRMVKGVIYLTSPIIASLLYDYLAAPLRCLAGFQKPPPTRPPNAGDIAGLFSGRVLAVGDAA